MHRFLIEGPAAIGAAVALPKEEARHAAQVLRLKPSAPVILLDGAGGLYGAVLEEASKTDVIARVVETLPSKEPKVRVTLYQGLAKGEKMEWILQKATELGVERVQPVLFSRCVAQGNGRPERWQRIALEAAKQCGRGKVPQVAEPIPFDTLVRRVPGHDAFAVPWEEASSGGLPGLLGAGARDVGLAIGPEGGIAPEEMAALEAAGARAVTLGPRILRTETAAIAALTMILFAMGEMGCQP